MESDGKESEKEGKDVFLPRAPRSFSRRIVRPLLRWFLHPFVRSVGLFVRSLVTALKTVKQKLITASKRQY